MADAAEADAANLLNVAAQLVVAESELLALLLRERKRKRALLAPAEVVKVGRRIYDRPVYTNSTWWTMLIKGECKIINHPQNKLFRRRFSVPYSMFKDIVTVAREWPYCKGTMGDIGIDCTGVEGVPLELKILGALRMSAKGCSFDAIAELSGMSISTMHSFYHLFRERFITAFRETWISYPTESIFPTRPAF